MGHHHIEGGLNIGITLGLLAGAVTGGAFALDRLRPKAVAAVPHGVPEVPLTVPPSPTTVPDSTPIPRPTRDTDEHIYATQTAIRANATNCLEDLPRAIVNINEKGQPQFEQGVGYDFGQLASNGVHYRFRNENDIYTRVVQGDGCLPVDDEFVFDGFYLAANGLYYKVVPLTPTPPHK